MTFSKKRKIRRNNSDETRAESPYKRFSSDRLILRDLLAIDRTVLANERTLLAYVRTSLALIITGAGYMRFFESAISDAIGCGLIILGFIAMIIGALRCAAMATRIKVAESKAPSPSKQATDTANIRENVAEHTSCAQPGTEAGNGR